MLYVQILASILVLPVFVGWEFKFKSHSSWDIILFKIENLMPLQPLMKIEMRKRVTENNGLIMRPKDQESWLRKNWSWQREVTSVSFFRQEKKKKKILHMCTYNLPRFIIGITVKEKFDHKQWVTWHRTVTKLIPTVNCNLYSAVKVTVAKITMNFHFILFSRSDAQYDSSAFLVKAKITPSNHKPLQFQQWLKFLSWCLLHQMNWK